MMYDPILREIAWTGYNRLAAALSIVFQIRSHPEWYTSKIVVVNG